MVKFPQVLCNHTYATSSEYLTPCWQHADGRSGSCQVLRVTGFHHHFFRHLIQDMCDVALHVDGRWQVSFNKRVNLNNSHAQRPWVGVGHNIGHFRGGLHSQSLDWYWQTKQYRKIQLNKLNTNQKKSKQPKIQQNKTTLVQLPITMLGQETRWAYSTMLPSPHGAIMPVSQRK